MSEGVRREVPSRFMLNRFSEDGGRLERRREGKRGGAVEVDAGRLAEAMMRGGGRSAIDPRGGRGIAAPCGRDGLGFSAAKDLLIRLVRIRVITYLE